MVLRDLFSRAAVRDADCGAVLEAMREDALHGTGRPNVAAIARRLGWDRRRVGRALGRVRVFVEGEGR
jgi:hypothetical protein